MRFKHRHLIVSGKHRRLQRTWQFFFTGWGLVAVAALAAAPFFTRNLLWTPISSFDARNVEMNQFRMENASFAGIDKNSEPFQVRADHAHQEYNDQTKIFLERVRANTVRIDNGRRITDIITADRGVYDREMRKITLTGNVKVDSSNGDKLRAKEMEIQL